MAVPPVSVAVCSENVPCEVCIMAVACLLDDIRTLSAHKSAKDVFDLVMSSFKSSFPAFNLDDYLLLLSDDDITAQ